MSMLVKLHCFFEGEGRIARTTSTCVKSKLHSRMSFIIANFCFKTALFTKRAVYKGRTFS